MQFRSIALVLMCVAIGLYLPDVDRVFPFLLHRSIVTHSAFIPLLVVTVLRRDGASWKHVLAQGLAVGIAVHLCFDLFPRYWTGYALISIPVLGWLDGTISTLWIAASIVACLYLVLRLSIRRSSLAILFVASLGALLFAAQRERTFWLPLFTLLIAWFIVSCLPNQIIRGQEMLRHLRQQFT